MSEQPCNWCNSCHIGFYLRSAFTEHMETKHLQGEVRIQTTLRDQERSVICMRCAKHYLVINKHLHPQNGHAPVWEPVDHQGLAMPRFACPVPKCASKIVNRMDLARHFVREHEGDAVAGLCHYIQRRFENFEEYKEFQTTMEDCFGTQFVAANGNRRFTKSKVSYLYCQYNRGVTGMTAPGVCRGKEVLVRKRITSTCPAYIKVEIMQKDGSVFVNGAICHYRHELQICPYLTEPHLRQDLIEAVLKGNGTIQIDKIRPTEEVRKNWSYDMKLRLLREHQKQNGTPDGNGTLYALQMALNEENIKTEPGTSQLGNDPHHGLRPSLTKEEALAKAQQQELEMVKLKESLKGVNKFYLNMAKEEEVPTEETELHAVNRKTERPKEETERDSMPCAVPCTSSIQQVKDEVEAVLNSKPIAILPPIPNKWPGYNSELPETSHSSYSQGVRVKAEIEDDASEYTAALNNQSIGGTTVKVEIKEEEEIELEDFKTQPSTSAALGTERLVVPVMELKRCKGRKPHTPNRPAAYLDCIGSNSSNKRKEAATPTLTQTPLTKKNKPPAPKMLVGPRTTIVVGKTQREPAQPAATGNKLRISLQCPKDQPRFANVNRNAQYRTFSDILFKK